MTAGLEGNVQSIKVLTILNQNGNSLVLANKHKDNRDPKNWKGFTFAVPFEQSHQTLQLRNYLAAAGLDPDQDVKYRIVPPTEYVASLRVGSIDGFFGGEPGGQRACSRLRSPTRLVEDALNCATKERGAFMRRFAFAKIVGLLV